MVLRVIRSWLSTLQTADKFKYRLQFNVIFIILKQYLFCRIAPFISFDKG